MWSDKHKKFMLNWPLVDKVIDYVSGRLGDLLLPTERHVVVSKYDLEEWSKRSPERMVTRVWDNKFQGNRHVVLDADYSHETWD